MNFYQLSIGLIFVFLSVPSSAEDCRVIKPVLYTPVYSAKYSGGCLNGLAHGFGIVEGNGRYKGMFANGLAHGNGILFVPDGSIYEGEWQNGQLHGFGKFSLTKNETDLIKSFEGGKWIGNRYVAQGLFEDNDFILACPNKNACTKQKAAEDSRTSSFFVLFICGIVGLWFITWIIKSVNESNKQAKIKRAEKKRQNEARLALEESQRTQKAIARAWALSNITELVSSAQTSAANLPLSISEAELSLDLAEREFSEGLYSPFWEAMENAVHNLSLFDKTLRTIEAAQQQHAIEAPPLAPDAVSFSLGVTLLPNPSATNQRMKALYRKAQKDPHFAQIYEQRRTNAILIEGFRSLGDALNYLGDRIESELHSLSDHLDFRLSDIESALRDSSNQMEKQHEAFLQTAQSWREEAQHGNSELIAVARSNAERAEKNARARREHETITRNMLDNIQHRRTPLGLHVSGGDY